MKNEAVSAYEKDIDNTCLQLLTHKIVGTDTSNKF